ncbi:MAG: serine hydrolase [Pseudomonadota bacterium]
MVKILKYGVGILVLAIVAAVIYLIIAPPDLLRVATNYSAKIVCSNVFISGRDANEVLAVDVQAPGHPLLKQISIDVDREAQTVTAKMFGFVATATSQHRQGLGCTNVHNTQLSDVELAAVEPANNNLWPQGNYVNQSQDPKMLDILSDEKLLGEGFRAVVVVKDGWIIGERYADGFDADTPMLGWSMTKTVTAGVIGTLIRSGRISLSDTLDDSYPEWAVDSRKGITVESMLAMSSGLEWNEGYGDVSDVTRMLFLRPNMADFASQFKAESEIGSEFVYSSGTSTMLSRFWQDKVGADSISYPREQIFAPLGMSSAVMETDAENTFVGSSYMYATARDWARYGLFLLRKGKWAGQQILPEGYTDWMFEPVEASDNRYTRGHLWRQVPGGKPPIADSVWLAGHDGQSVGIFPSDNMIVVRLGLTPSKVGYSPGPLAQALLNILGD